MPLKKMQKTKAVYCQMCAVGLKQASVQDFWPLLEDTLTAAYRSDLLPNFRGSRSGKFCPF